jgi:hypothetical protein
VARKRTERIWIRLTDAEAAFLDEMRPDDVSRSEFVRRLIAASVPDPGEAPITRDEVIELLIRAARRGVVGAQKVLLAELDTAAEEKLDADRVELEDILREP